jgi:tetratricopeptide (TPR) repeat protein
LQVRVGDRGFDQLTDGSLLELDPEGYVTTPPLAGLAYVQIWQAGQVAFEFPVPILDEWTEVERRIPVDAQGREKAEFQRLLDYQTRDLRLLHENLNAAMRHLNSLNEAKRYEEARDACAALLREFRSSGRAVSSRLTELEKLATSLGLQDQPRLRQVSDDAKKLQGRVSDLANLHESLQRTIEKAEAQARADVLIELGKQALDAYEIDDAIDKFKLALIEQPDQPELKQQLEALEETWRVKSSQHRAARELVFEAWAHAELTELEEMLPKVRQAAQTLLRYKDHLSLGRLLHANTEHIVAISELIDELANRGTTEDQQEGGKWADVSETLDNFNQELTGYIDSLTNSGSPDDPARPVQPDAAAAKQPDQDAAPSTPSSQPTSTSPPDGSPPAGKAAEDEEEE